MLVKLSCLENKIVNWESQSSYYWVTLGVLFLLVVLISKVGKRSYSAYERCFEGFGATHVTEERRKVMAAWFQDVRKMSHTERRAPVFSLQQGPSAPLVPSVGPSMGLPWGSSSPRHLVCAMEETDCGSPPVSCEHCQDGRWGVADNLTVCSSKHVTGKGILKARKFSLNFRQVSADSTGLVNIWETFPKFSLRWFSFHCGIGCINNC